VLYVDAVWFAFLNGFGWETQGLFQQVSSYVATVYTHKKEYSALRHKAIDALAALLDAYSSPAVPSDFPNITATAYCSIQCPQLLLSP
jgi:hypothetical protein